MNINKVHCLFEQSGTFKNEFKKGKKYLGKSKATIDDLFKTENEE